MGVLSALPLKLGVFKEIAISDESGDRLHCQRRTAQLLSMDKMNGKEVGGFSVPIRKQFL